MLVQKKGKRGWCTLLSKKEKKKRAVRGGAARKGGNELTFFFSGRRKGEGRRQRGLPERRTKRGRPAASAEEKRGFL